MYFLVHVEHQAQRQAAFGERMFRYYAQLRLQRGLPVYPIALFSYRKPATAEPTTYCDRFLGSEFLRFSYQVVQLNRLDWRRYVRNPNPVACALMARMKFKVAERPRVKLQCLRLLATLRLDTARTHLVSAFVDSYLRLTSTEEQDFRERAHELEPTEEQAVLKLTTSWKEEGLAEGLAQAKEVALATLAGTLPRLFGPEAGDFLVLLRDHASLEQLRAVAQALSTPSLNTSTVQIT